MDKQKIFGTQQEPRGNTSTGVDNISYISDISPRDNPRELAQVHSQIYEHRQSQDIRQAALDCHRLSLDLDGGNRRSRHYGISDTNVLTSPNEPQTSDYSSAGSDSGLKRSPPATAKNRPNYSSSSFDSSGLSVGTDRSSIASNISVLRQTSTFSLELTPSVAPAMNEHPTVAGDNRTIPDRAVQICVYPAFSNNNTVLKTEQAQIHKKPVVAQLSKTEQIDKYFKQARVPRDSHIRRFVRQVSGRKDDFQAYDVTEYQRPYHTGNAKRPKSYFDLAILTMCCCISPVGFAAVVFSVLSDANYKAAHMDKAKNAIRCELQSSTHGQGEKVRQDFNDAKHCGNYYYAGYIRDASSSVCISLG